MIDPTMKEQWAEQIKQAMENGRSSVPPYEVVPYKNGLGIKKIIIQKQEIS